MKKLVFLLTMLMFISAFGQMKVKNFKYYSVGYDSIGTHWVSYRLTKQMVQNQTPRKRVSFKRFNQWTTSDYTNSSFDRGHLLSANAMGFDQEAYEETFSMANVAPMTPSLNRQVWKYLENYEERLAVTHDCITTVVEIVYLNLKVGSIYIPEKFTKKICECDGSLISEHEFENL